MTFTELTNYSSEDFIDLDELLVELEGNIVLTREALDRALASGDSHLFVMRDADADGKVPGTNCEAGDGDKTSTGDEASANCEAGDGDEAGAKRNTGAGHIVACASLCVFYQPFRTDATIEAVVVAEKFRGCGLGRQVMEKVIAQARRMGVEQLHLTSRPSRIAANELYKSLGFRKKETNCYIMDL